MTRVERHPNCRCGAEVGDNPYCIIHGRIRDMDQGASPFVDVDAVAGEVADSLGIEEEDIDRTMDVPGVIADMHRKNMDRDLESLLNASFDGLKSMDEPGCKCAVSHNLGTGVVTRHVHPDCPVHGGGARQGYDVEGTAEDV